MTTNKAPEWLNIFINLISNYAPNRLSQKQIDTFKNDVLPYLQSGDTIGIVKKLRKLLTLAEMTGAVQSLINIPFLKNIIYKINAKENINLPLVIYEKLKQIYSAKTDKDTEVAISEFILIMKYFEGNPIIKSVTSLYKLKNKFFNWL